MINIIKEINDYFQLVLYYLSRNKLDKVVIGSAKRSGKSFGTAHLLVYLMVTQGSHLLCLRKNSSKLRESVWTEINNAITDWNLQRYFKISSSPADMRITYLPYGNQAIFKGVNTGSADKEANAASLGSFNFYNLTNKTITPTLVTWFEEAYEFEDNDIATTIYSYPTFSKIVTFMTFNNWSSVRKIVKDLDKYAKGDAEKLENEGIVWNYVDNDEHAQTLFVRTSAWINQDHLNKETISEFKALRIYDYRKYETVVLGMSGVSGDIAYTSFKRNMVEVTDEEFKDVLRDKYGYVRAPDYYRIGIDYGRKRDSNAFVLKFCYGDEQDLMYVPRAQGFSNLGQVNPKDNIGIAEEVIKFIIQAANDYPLIKYHKVIVQIDRAAEGLYDIVFRQINQNFQQDLQGELLKDYVIVLESWKDKVMQRVLYDNFLFRHGRHFINSDHAAALLDEIENIHLDVDTHGKYFRIDENDHWINAWEYTNTKDDRRKQLGNSKERINSINDLQLDLDLFS